MTDLDHVSPHLQTMLLRQVESYEWTHALARVLSHPHEATFRGPRGRTALHICCDHDAPAILIEALLAAYPEAASMVGTSDMTPLHITCTSERASVDVVRVLLRGSPTGRETSARDIDGDTPLHAACRCGAPMDVLKELLKADPSVVLTRDNEGLTPLLRLWVRYYVKYGEDAIEHAVQNPAKYLFPRKEMAQAWEKTIVLLQVAHHGHLFDTVDGEVKPSYAPFVVGAGFPLLPKSSSIWARTPCGKQIKFRPVHAACAVDCPRAVLRIAVKLYPNQVVERDEMGRLPIQLAAMAPRYKVHDLSESGGYNYDDLDGDRSGDIEEKDFFQDEENPEDDADEKDPNIIEREDGSSVYQPPVIQVVVKAKPQLASVTDSYGRLPLHVALDSGKCWVEGVRDVVRAHPEGLNTVDSATRLLPFMLAAVGGGIRRGRFQLNTIYELIKADPEVVRLGLKSELKKMDPVEEKAASATCTNSAKDAATAHDDDTNVASKTTPPPRTTTTPPTKSVRDVEIEVMRSIYKRSLEGNTRHQTIS